MAMRVRDAYIDWWPWLGSLCSHSELQGVTVDFTERGPQRFTYGLRRPGPSIARMYREHTARGLQGAVCRQRTTPAWIGRLAF
jgi:hypothetical protein